MEFMVAPAIVGLFLAFIGFRQWLQLQQRAMIHRERMAAIEKGADLPPWPAEKPRNGIRSRQILLLSGLIWMGLGFGGMVTGYFVLSSPVVRAMPDVAPPEAAIGGLIFILIGAAHMVVYKTSAETKE